jgi:hypothetical protein
LLLLELSFFVLGEDSAIEYEIHSARPSSATSKPPSDPDYHQSVAVWGFPFHVAELALFADESRRLSLDLAARRETRRQERLTVWPTMLLSRRNLLFDFPRDRHPWARWPLWFSVVMNSRDSRSNHIRHLSSKQIADPSSVIHRCDKSGHHVGQA